MAALIAVASYFRIARSNIIVMVRGVFSIYQKKKKKNDIYCLSANLILFYIIKKHYKQFNNLY